MSALLAVLFLLVPVSPGTSGGAPLSPDPSGSAHAVASAVAPVVLSPPADDPAPSAHGVWPLAPRPAVVRGFDPPQLRWGRGHRGVDLAGRSGQPVHAALGGRITFAGRLAGRGVVVVDHGDVRTTYEPVRSTVHVGDLVARGGRIGVLELGSSHCFPRSCLHWGLLRGPTYLNPLILVGAGPLRLLPETAPWPMSPAPASGPRGLLSPEAATAPPGPAAGKLGTSAGSWRLRPVGAPAGRPRGAART